MTDTLTIGDMPIPKDRIHAVAAKLREDGHDKSADEIETAVAIGLKHMQVSAREHDALQHAIEAV